jgi:hypothetical protein
MEILSNYNKMFLRNGAEEVQPGSTGSPCTAAYTEYELKKVDCRQRELVGEKKL